MAFSYCHGRRQRLAVFFFLCKFCKTEHNGEEHGNGADSGRSDRPSNRRERLAVVDAVKTGRERAPISRERVRRAAREALTQLETALGDGDSKRAKEMTGVLRDMVQLYRELQGGGSQSVTVCFVGETEEAAR